MPRRYPPFPFGEIVSIVFSVAVVAAVVGLTAWLGEDWRTWWDARSWSPARCTVVRGPAEVGGLKYEYERAGVRYEGSSVVIGGDPGAATGMSAGLERGASVPCWVDPERPSRALLDTGYEAGWLLPGAWLVAVLLLSGALRGVPTLWRWLVYRPDPPLTWREWRLSFHRNGAWKWTSVGSMFLALGLVATWGLSIVPVWNWWRAQDWQATTCVIVEGPVRWQSAGRFPSRGRYVMDLAFTYQAGGQRHVAYTYSPWRAGSVEWLLSPPREVQKDRIIELTTAFALGTVHRCYVPGDDTGAGYIERSFWNGWYGIAVIGPLFVLFGLALVMARPRG